MAKQSVTTRVPVGEYDVFLVEGNLISCTKKKDHPFVTTSFSLPKNERTNVVLNENDKGLIALGGSWGVKVFCIFIGTEQGPTMYALYKNPTVLLIGQITTELTAGKLSENLIQGLQPEYKFSRNLFPF